MVFLEVTQFNRLKLWCPPKCVSFAQLNRFSLPHIVLALSSAVTKLSSGGSRGRARPPLFLDQTEARRAEKNFGGDRAPPPPPPLNLKVWIRHCYQTKLYDFQGPTIKFHDFLGQENEMLKFHNFPGFL